MHPFRIGPLLIDPPIFSAPLAGFSGYAYRHLLRRLGGAGLIAAEMVSARSFIHREKRRGELPDQLWGVKEEPRPLAVQIWDNDPAKMAEVGRRLAFEFGASVVDINFGCPMRDVAEKAESGSYLLRYPERIGEIVARVAKACARAGDGENPPRLHARASMPSTWRRPSSSPAARRSRYTAARRRIFFAARPIGSRSRGSSRT